MSLLAPTYSWTIGKLSSSTETPALGPGCIRVDRDMDIPADAARLQLMERAGIALDDEVVIALGHDGNNETVFTGNVVSLRPALAGVEIHALGTMSALLSLRTASVFENEAAGSIANSLIARAGLSGGTVDEGPLLPHFTVDDRVSAFVHVKGLADRLGYELYADRDGNIRFHALGGAKGLDAGGLSAVVGAAGALLGAGGSEGYAFGRHLVLAEARRRPAAVGAVTVGGESPMSGQGDTTAHWLTVNDAAYRGSAGDGSPSLLVIDPVARYKDLAERFAAGRLALAARAAHQIEVTVLGRNRIDLGDDIALSGVPDALIDGAGYIRALRHRFDDVTGFVTDVRISLTAD